MFLSLSLECPVCGDRPALRTLPLCPECIGSLIRCPPLCAECGETDCTPAACARPWRSPPSSGARVQVLGATYLLLARGYRVLKRWKVQQGLLFDRQVLAPVRIPLSGHPFETSRTLVVPIPQALGRSWVLGGNPAQAVASALAGRARFELWASGLRRVSSGDRPSVRRQAERSLVDRISSPPRFEATRSFWGRDVILVDDFMTTGRTLRSAAQALALGGARSIHLYALGYRPLTRKAAGDSLRLRQSQGSPFGGP